MEKRSKHLSGSKMSRSNVSGKRKGLVGSRFGSEQEMLGAQLLGGRTL